MQNFYINQGATLPKLRVELINDGRFDFLKTERFNNAIQNADAWFSMRDANGRIKIQKSPAVIIESLDTSCEERFIIEYEWVERDTKQKGEFIGKFEIDFHDGLYESNVVYDKGKLIAPIAEELVIFIQ